MMVVDTGRRMEAGRLSRSLFPEENSLRSVVPLFSRDVSEASLEFRLFSSDPTGIFV